MNNKWKMNNGEELNFVHDEKDCMGDRCPIHKPTRHHMRDWEMHWDKSIKMLFRSCKHGYTHPDPDDWKANTIDCSCGCRCCGCRCCKTLTKKEKNEIIRKYRQRVD